MNVTPPDITAEIRTQLQVYFAVDYETRLLATLVDGRGSIRSGSRRSCAIIRPSRSSRGGSHGRRRALCILGHMPERYVHLVASAFGRSLIELDDAARFFDSDIRGSSQSAAAFHYKNDGRRRHETATASIPPDPSEPELTIARVPDSRPQAVMYVQTHSHLPLVENSS